LARRIANVAKNINETHAVFDRHHEGVMRKRFGEEGITAATAEKLVAAVKEKSRG